MEGNFFSVSEGTCANLQPTSDPAGTFPRIRTEMTAFTTPTRPNAESPSQSNSAGKEIKCAPTGKRKVKPFTNDTIIDVSA